MADEQHEVRTINWTEVFGFTQIFKSFRMSINLSSIGLALVALLLIWIGGTALDEFWSMSSSGYVGPNEIFNHYNLTSTGYEDNRELWLEGRDLAAARLLVAQQGEAETLTQFQAAWAPESPQYLKAFQDKLQEANKDSDYTPADPQKLADDEPWHELLDDADEAFERQLERIDNLAAAAYDPAVEAVRGLTGDAQDEARDQLEESRERIQRAIARRRQAYRTQVKQIRGGQIFESLRDYTWTCLSNGLTAVRYGNITGGLGTSPTIANPNVAPVTAGNPAGAVPPGVAVRPQGETCGFLCWVLLGVNGIMWLLWEHLIYAILFLLWSLAVVALFGGAVHRIAALQATRQEKISWSQGLKFSFSKFFSFFTAPLLPIGIILLLGALIALGGLVGNLWGFGAFLIGLLMFLALILGLVVAFLVVGLIGGFPLMYPTIAVEGSDSFDAISRSFSYIFARPWRALLYGLIALVYGVLCYVFIRLFAFIALACTWSFAKWGVFQGGQAVGAGDKLSVMWSEPTYTELLPPFSWSAMTTWEAIGAFFIWIYVALIATAVMAFLLSFAASATTNIYLLLRRKVDATDLDDVYVEEIDEEPLPEPIAETGSAAVDQQKAEEAEAETAPQKHAEGEKPVEGAPAAEADEQKRPAADTAGPADTAGDADEPAAEPTPEPPTGDEGEGGDEDEEKKE